MILNFKLKNYNSYKEEQSLDFEKKSKEHLGMKFVNKKKTFELLKVVGLVGVNGSGKTSLLEGLDFMKAMVLNSTNHIINTKIRYNNFAKNPGPIKFEITFISEGKKYIYGFSYTEIEVVEEYAFVYETQKPKELFFRKKQTFSFKNEKYEKELKSVEDSVIPQTLFLSRAVQLNSQVLKPVFEFFTKLYSLNAVFTLPIDFSYLKDEFLKEKLLEKLCFADFSIVDLELVKTQVKHISLIPNGENSGTIEQKILEKEIQDLVLVHKHNNELFKVSILAESSGTRKFIAMFYNLLKMNQDSVILFDEIENSFNIEIVKFVLDYFSGEEVNSQLLFTTHQPEILNCLRSDQINIIEKEDAVSNIVNLHDIVKSNSKINKNYGEYYKEGVLGGFPNVYKGS
jgi:hypothetical protein